MNTVWGQMAASIFVGVMIGAMIGLVLWLLFVGAITIGDWYWEQKDRLRKERRAQRRKQ